MDYLGSFPLGYNFPWVVYTTDSALIVRLVCTSSIAPLGSILPSMYPVVPLEYSQDFDSPAKSRAPNDC